MKTTASKVKIVIVDDHRLFNDGLFGMLKDEMDILAQVYDSREAEKVVRDLQPDVVLVDFNMPHINGIELTQALVTHSKEIKVLILSMYNEEMYIERFKRSGCRGYIFKTASLQEVTAAIHAVYAGETYFPDSKKSNIHKDDLFLKKL